MFNIKHFYYNVHLYDIFNFMGGRNLFVNKYTNWLAAQK